MTDENDKPRKAGAFKRVKGDKFEQIAGKSPDLVMIDEVKAPPVTDNEELTLDDIAAGACAICECCKKWEFKELMSNRDDGFYCEVCTDDIFG